MSRNLPDRPNLEFLKREAKALFDSMLHRDPAAQLADAPHALARDYGFASWPKLKAHVESVAAVALASVARSGITAVIFAIDALKSFRASLAAAGR